MTKKELKALVKACLIEILQEGLGGNAFNMSASETRQMVQPRQQQQSFQERQNPGLKTSPKQTAAALTEYFAKAKAAPPPINTQAIQDPMMAAILGAQETMAKQNSRGHGQAGALARMSTTNAYQADLETPSGGDMAGKIVMENEPSDIFGEDANSKWAALAFSDFKR